MSLKEPGMPSPMLGPNQSQQSVSTAGAMPGQRDIQTRASLEEPEVVAEAAPAEGAPVEQQSAEQVDPVVEEVVETVQEDAEKKAEVEAHEVAGPDELAEIAASKQSLEEIEAQRIEMSSGFDKQLEDVFAKMESGDLSTSQAMLEQNRIERERQAALEPIVEQKIALQSDIKSLERGQQQQVASFRNEYLNDPEVKSLLEDSEVQRMLNQPTKKEKALGLDYPPAAVAHRRSQMYRQEIEGLKAQLAEKEASVAAAANKNVPVGSGSAPKPEGVSTQTNKSMSPQDRMFAAMQAVRAQA